MTTYFVDSVTGSAANNGLSWAAAYDKLQTAISGAGGSSALVGGDTVFVSDQHNETAAVSTTLTFPVSNTAWANILCADHTVTTPGPNDLKTTGKVSTTGASNLTLQGNIYVYGLILTAGDAANTALLATGGTTNGHAEWDTCQFILGSTSSSSRIQTVTSGAASAGARWTNCKVQFGAVGQQINPFGGFTWRNTPSAVMGSTFPTQIIGNGSAGAITIDGVDFSAITGSQLTQGNISNCRIIFKDCLLQSAFAGFGNAGSGLDMNVTEGIRSDTAGAGRNYRFDHVASLASVLTETTVVRTGGATDGAVPFSRKCATGANRFIPWGSALNFPPIATWIDGTVGSPITATVHATSNLAAGAFPFNDDIWLEVSYLGDPNSPLASFVDNNPANILATHTAYTNDGSSWGGSPAGGKFAMSVTFTPQQKGYIYAVVYVAKPSTTFYVDPLVVLS